MVMRTVCILKFIQEWAYLPNEEGFLPSNIHAAATAELTTYAGECEFATMSKSYDAGH